MSHKGHTTPSKGHKDWDEFEENLKQLLPDAFKIEGNHLPNNFALWRENFPEEANLALKSLAEEIDTSDPETNQEWKDFCTAIDYIRIIQKQERAEKSRDGEKEM